MLSSDLAWYDDVRALSRRPSEFVVTRDQSSEERLNALVRLVMYASFAVFLYNRRAATMAFGLCAVAVMSLAHKAHRDSGPGCGRAGCARRNDPRGPMVERPHAMVRSAMSSAPSGTGATAGATAGSAAPADRARPACTVSTPDNPYANMLISDLATNPGRAPACTFEEHKDLVERHANAGLVHDAYDRMYEQGNWPRFLTMPVTTATADTIAFAQFCYGNEGRKTCKEDTTMCRW